VTTFAICEPSCRDIENGKPNGRVAFVVVLNKGLGSDARAVINRVLLLDSGLGFENEYDSR